MIAGDTVPGQRHIIGREILDVALTGTESDGLVLQRRLTDLCRDWLGPALEAVLERVAPDDEHWSIDRLVIDAGSFSPDTLERDFVGAVAEAVGREINDRAGGRGGALQRRTPIRREQLAPDVLASMPDLTGAPLERLSDEQYVSRAVLHFLRTGSLPWWYRLPEDVTLEQAVLVSWPQDGPPSETARRFIGSLDSAVMRRRLIRQFSPSFLATVVNRAAAGTASVVADGLAKLAHSALPEETRGRLSEAVWDAVLVAVASGGAAIDEVVAATITSLLVLEAPAVRTPGRGPGTRSETHSATVTSGTGDSAVADLDEATHVDCAGIVLLHPFLPRLFAALDIARDDKLLQPDRALGLLHFLATGERRAPEYALVLAKLLCNLPRDEPVAAPVEVTDLEMEEAGALLEAVVGHWQALGNSSVDALRGTFLVRPGRLSRRDGEPLLQVERQAYDILLDRLPWGIGSVKLPWMKSILWVEWAN